MPEMEDLKRRMEGSLNSLSNELKGLRTGRASASLLEPLQVDAYGSMLPINHVGSIGVPEPRLITIQVWDTNLVPSVEKAIRNSDLGLNPASEGNVVRIPLPELNEERRNELVKIAGKYSENARVAVRNIRRDGIENLRKAEKDGNISKDEQHTQIDEIQKLTDEFINKIDTALKAKEKEITTV